MRKGQTIEGEFVPYASVHQMLQHEPAIRADWEGTGTHINHAAVHEDHKLLREVAGISRKQRCPLAPWSPDFQQPIEHAHGRFKEKFRASLRDNHTKKEMNEFMKEAKRVWEEVNQAEIVNKDVERLPQLYRYVVQENTGDWAPANLS